GTQKNCKGSTLKSPPPSNQKCCGGNISKCSKSNCCLGCQECREIKEAKKFSRALKALRFAGPCGLDLYRVLNDFLNFCCNVFWPYVDKKEVKEKIEEAKKKCLSGCSSSGTPCSCSDCDGCKALRGHNDIMSILRHGYVSSYTYKFESVIDPPAKGTYASWNSLCASGSKCCSNPSCSQCSPSGCSSSGSSCPSQCCPDCPQRKAAKIFLGMLPCLYYGLKILYDRAQDPLTWPDWHDISVSNDKPESALAKFFHALGYDLRPLKSKKGSEFFSLLEKLFGSDSSGPLQKLSTLVTEKYFTSHLISSGSQDPSTVRQMLLWLYGLRFTSGFSSLVSRCTSLCSPSENSFNADAFCYYIHASCFLLPVAIISLIEDSLSITSLHSEFSKFFYPSDPSDLFEKLCEYARKIFVALNFLYYQCERNAGQGGWNDCAFGRGCVNALKSSSPSKSPSTSSSGCTSCANSGAYLCTAINKDTVHDHCQKGSCLGFGSSASCSHSSSKGKPCKPCPHPLLRFLCHSKPNSNSQDYPFGLSRIVPMGFDSSKLPATPVKGEDLYHALKDFCKDGFYPLTRLAEFILCVSQRPPETLGELFAFFKKFAGALNSKPDLSSKFVDWIEGEPGRFFGNSLKGAIQGLYGSNSHSTSHSPANLFSLFGCDGQKLSSGTSHPTCGKYLHALTEEAYNIFIDKFADTYLSWICYRAGNFYSEFQKFHTAAEKKFSSCCTSCKKIVECPCALPFIYSHGFTLNSPSGLNCVDNEGKSNHGSEQKKETGKHSQGDSKCTMKSCSQFLTQLKLVAEGQPLEALLKAIDEFLWSIREPFFLFVLSFWILVFAYFIYVQLYKLDILELNSHDHPAWSFKIPPSILFSDASSKLKDLSYFTL
ncbi:variant erythrocyte surface antigen-1 family protein, partial [Babesia divergens]